MDEESGDHREGASGSSVPALAALAASRLGQVVGDRWQLKSVIGVGGTASVYAARHRNGREAALKVLHPELARDARSRKRFLREAYAANRVGHPGAVSVIDDGELPDGTPFLLLELISGTPLTAFSNDASRLPVSDVVAIGAGILDVLAAAHDAGVVHRDIKPSNVILTHERLVKVLDFGIAKFHDATDRDPLLTRSESSLGTPAFMSPEQSAGRSAEVDARSDLFSVGATLFWLLTGRYVHMGTSSNELLIATATTQAASIATARGDLPPHVVTAIDRALALDRTRRWPNARAMKAMLTATPEEDPASVVTIPEQPSTRTRARARPLGMLVAAALVSVAIAGAWVFSRSTPSPEGSAAVAAPRAVEPPPVAATEALPVQPAVEPPPAAASAPPRAVSVPRGEAVPSKPRAPRMAVTGAPSASSVSSAPRPRDALFDRRQ
jgi:serine/threonine protein kinase